MKSDLPSKSSQETKESLLHFAQRIMVIMLNPQEPPLRIEKPLVGIEPNFTFLPKMYSSIELKGQCLFITIIYRYQTYSYYLITTPIYNT